MTIADFLIDKGWGKNNREIKKKFYRKETVHKIGIEFLVNGRKIIDIYYELNKGDELRFLYNGVCKYIVD